MEQIVLQLEKLNKSFGNLHVLKDLDLEVAKGEVLTLLGPSGCGKTTTLNLVAGLINPDSGKIILRGEIVNAYSPQKRKVGMVFQSWALFPHMTVYENIAFGLKVKKWPKSKIDQKVREMLSLIQLPNIQNKFPSQLSGGMRQRVAFARALAVEPDVLLLDEPFSNLDELLRRQMEVETRRLQQQIGITTLFVTHNQEEALVMSDRVAVMSNGKIVQVDTPLKVYNDPRTSFVCEFLGDANIFEGQVSEVKASHVLVECGGVTFVSSRLGFNAGEEVTVAIRPERISLSRDTGSSDPANLFPNMFPARVSEVVYKGPTAVYSLILKGVHNVVVTEQCLNPEEIKRPGEEVYLKIPPDAVLLFKKERNNG